MGSAGVAVATRERVLPEVPVLCPGGTVACLATGPSLTQADANYLRGRVDAVVVVNNAYQMAPWADVLYAADHKWWRWANTDPVRHPTFHQFTGLKFATGNKTNEWPNVTKLQTTRENGLELQRTGLAKGAHSGYQAINLAVHLGAKTIILLGYDMKAGPRGKKHCHPDHPDNSVVNFQAWLPQYRTLVEPLKAQGVRVINCTRSTAIHCFEKMRLEEALP